METTEYDIFMGTVIKSLLFHPNTLEKARYQNDAVSEGSTFETALESLLIHQRFRSL